jgi:urease accessory protein
MIRANFISTKGAWQATPADSIVLDYEGRHRRRVAMTGTRGTEFLLDLPDAVVLRGGDALILEDGRLIEIIAAPEPLAEVRCADPRQLARVAYHVGNRHAQAEILANRIRVRRDHVLEDMVRGLGAKVAHIEAPFEPDTGAYEAADEGHSHSHKGHDHKGHDHKNHAHDHHDHGHKHEHGAHAHAHDDACCDDPAHKHEHAHEGHDHKAHDHGHSHGAHGHKHD